MSKQYETSLFIFRRDLRLNDNTALLSALETSEQVIPCFIFDPRQLDSNKYRSDNAVQFMLESLQAVSESLKKRGGKLYFFYGKTEEVVGELITKQNVQALFVNRDYTPFSIKRDKRLEKISKENSIPFVSEFDLLLTEVGTVLTGDGNPYQVYSYFAKKAAQRDIPRPRKNTYKNFYSKDIASSKDNIFDSILPKSQYNEKLFISGGRKVALKILRAIGGFSNYDDERNFPAVHGTTGLSAHNKFGTVSPREVYHAVSQELGSDHTLIRELFWRDFFTHIAFHFPYVFGRSFHEKYKDLPWENDKKKFTAWCEGRTGYPIVDAGMRELNETGFMHNRVRMIVASFLVKDLHIDWQWGEKYFAQQLVDYDPAVNNGNWQWAASTGCDAQPYFRIFNPWIQGKKFDLECEYIHQWIPELREFDSKEIHKLQKGGVLGDYPEAIVDHAEVKHIAEDMFSEAASATK